MLFRSIILIILIMCSCCASLPVGTILANTGGTIAGGYIYDKIKEKYPKHFVDKGIVNKTSPKKKMTNTNNGEIRKRSSFLHTELDKM